MARSVVGTVSVAALRGEELRDVETFARQDPFVKVMVEVDGVLHCEGRTCTIRAGGRNPSWTDKSGNQVFLPFECPSPMPAGMSWTLRIEAWDAEDSGHHRIIGMSLLHCVHALWRAAGAQVLRRQCGVATCATAAPHR
jgi:hypothetical protein